MLKAASRVFLTDIGHAHLHEVHSLDYSDNAQPLYLVLKKKKFFWVHSVTDPLEFRLKDILSSGSSLPDFPLETKTEVMDFKSTTSFNAKGEVGAQLAKVLHVNLGGSDSINFNSPLGKVMKSSVDVKALSDVLVKQKADLDNKVIKTCLASNWLKSLSLGVIVETWYLDQDVKLTATVQWSAEAGADVTPAAKASASINEKTESVFTVPAKTVIAFRTLNLLINTNDGSIQCGLDVLGSKGCCGFCSTQDEVDLELDGLSTPEIKELRAIPNDQKQILRKNLFQLCEHPAIIHSLWHLFGVAETTDKELKLDSEQWNDNEKAIATKILQDIGFTVKQNQKVDRPKNFNPRFHAISMVVASLTVVPDPVMTLLSHLEAEETQSLFTLVRVVLGRTGSDHKKGDGFENILSETQTTACKITKNLGISKSNNEDLYYSGNFLVLESLLRILYSIYDIKDE